MYLSIVSIIILKVKRCKRREYFKIDELLYTKAGKVLESVLSGWRVNRGAQENCQRTHPRPSLLTFD
jgi:hypothetical protein